MSRFPTAAHLCAWAGVAPGNHESAGKQLSGKTRKGNRALRRALVEAARAGGEGQGQLFAGAISSFEVAMRSQSGDLVAVAHSILQSIYYHAGS